MTVVALPAAPSSRLLRPVRPGVMMRRFDPRPSIPAVTCREAPSPRAVMTITAVTPIITPKVVRTERRGLAASPSRAIRKLSRVFMAALPPPRVTGR